MTHLWLRIFLVLLRGYFFQWLEGLSWRFAYLDFSAKNCLSRKKLLCLYQFEPPPIDLKVNNSSIIKWLLWVFSYWSFYFRNVYGWEWGLDWFKQQKMAKNNRPLFLIILLHVISSQTGLLVNLSNYHLFVEYGEL